MSTCAEISAEIISLREILAEKKQKFNDVGQVIGDGNSCLQDATDLHQKYEKITSEFLYEANIKLNTQSGDKIEIFKFRTSHLNDVFQSTNSQIGILVSSINDALQKLTEIQRKLNNEMENIKRQIDRLQLEYNSAFMRENESK